MAGDGPPQRAGGWWKPVRNALCASPFRAGCLNLPFAGSVGCPVYAALTHRGCLTSNKSKGCDEDGPATNFQESRGWCDPGKGLRRFPSLPSRRPQRRKPSRRPPRMLRQCIEVCGLRRGGGPVRPQFEWYRECIILHPSQSKNRFETGVFRFRAVWKGEKTCYLSTRYSTPSGC